MNIKFRAWHKELKQMIPVHSLHMFYDSNVLYSNTKSASKAIANFTDPSVSVWIADIQMYQNHKLDTVELMQWTGLQDVNDKDVYDGDIIEWGSYEYTKDNKRIYIVKRGAVIYKNGHPKIHYKDYINDEPNISDLYYYLDYLRADNKAIGSEFYRNPIIIGNIYQNSELLVQNA